MTTLALIVGLVIVNLWRPGAGMNVDLAALDTRGIQSYTRQAGEQSTLDFFMHIVPNTVRRRLCRRRDPAGVIFCVLFAFALHALGEHGKPLTRLIDQTAHAFFRSSAS